MQQLEQPWLRSAVIHSLNVRRYVYTLPSTVYRIPVCICLFALYGRESKKNVNINIPTWLLSLIHAEKPQIADRNGIWNYIVVAVWLGSQYEYAGKEQNDQNILFLFRQIVLVGIYARTAGRIFPTNAALAAARFLSFDSRNCFNQRLSSN